MPFRKSGSGSSGCRLELNATRLKVSASSSVPVMDQSQSKTSSGTPSIVEVDLGNRSYPIYIGSGLLDQPDLLQRYWIYSFLLFYFEEFKYYSSPSVGDN